MRVNLRDQREQYCFNDTETTLNTSNYKKHTQLTWVWLIVLQDEGGRRGEHGGLLTRVAKQERVIPPRLFCGPPDQTDLHVQINIINNITARASNNAW